MYQRFHRFLMLVLLSFMVVACATTPDTKDAEHVATAKRFLHSWSAGEVVMASFRRALEEEAKAKPAMAELIRRAFADANAEDFEDKIALIYARNLTQENLTELTQFSESRTGNRFFRVAVASVLEGKKDDDMTRHFNADELTEIVKFTQSNAFTALKQALPTINRELSEEGRRWGEATMRDYLNRQ